MILASLIDTEVLGKVILYSLVTSVGGTAFFSLAIVGMARFDEVRRGTRHGSAALYAGMAAVCILVVAGVAVEAIIVMAKK